MYLQLMTTKKLKRLLKLAVEALDQIKAEGRHPQCPGVHASIASNSGPTTGCRCAVLLARDAAGSIAIQLGGGRSVVDSW